MVVTPGLLLPGPRYGNGERLTMRGAKTTVESSKPKTPTVVTEWGSEDQ